VVGVLIVVVALLLGLTLVVSPGVGDAQARTAAIVRSHGATSDGGRVPARVASALIATEDSRFYSHSGLDARGALRGIFTFSRGGALGGATIDAQLAKLLYLDGQKGVLATFKEVGLALKLDHHYSKQQILAMYFDAAYFGHGAYGVVDAARTYFGRSPDNLSWAQATMLAGLVNAPSAYDPTAHFTLARERQRHVLDRMVATGRFTKAQADETFAAPLHPEIPFQG
jgi:penicillin-binding protein 1A